MSEEFAFAEGDMFRRALRRLLRPLTHLLVKVGITLPVLTELLRELYIEAALSMTSPEKRTDSRISLMTGIHRKELRRWRMDATDGDAPPQKLALSAAIIGRWVGSPRWIAPDGRPRVLARTGRRSFELLVSEVTKDLRPRTVYDEWLAQGIISLDADERIRLSEAAYLPKVGGEEQLYYFSRNLGDHIAAAAANVTASTSPPFLDRSVHYDHLTPEQAERLEAVARREAQRLLEHVNREAMRMVGDAPEDPAETHRVNLGVYLFAEDEKRDKR
jgi:hypothetical protein